MSEHMKIPKTIHYCWFGGNPLSDLAIKCIESWKKYCPDYEFIQWNEQNFDVRQIPYSAQAYEAGKWAFVSDYARFKILYDHGGVYLDTEVGLLRPLDAFLDRGGFMASESHQCDVNTGLGVATPKGLPLYEEILQDYENSSFLKPDGSPDRTTVVTRITRILERHGLERRDTEQRIAGIVIYPKEYFCPLDHLTRKMEITEKTYSIHYYDSSWWTEEQKYAGKLAVRFRKCLPEKAAKRLAKAIAICHHRGCGSMLREFRRSLKK